MSDHEWSMAIGLRNAVISVAWRTAVAAFVVVGAAYALYAGLDALGDDFVVTGRLSTAVALLFCFPLGTAVGFVVARGLNEKAGFVSLLVTLAAAVGGAAAVLVGEAIAASIVETRGHGLGMLVIIGTIIATTIWVVKLTIIEQ